MTTETQTRKSLPKKAPAKAKVKAKKDVLAPLLIEFDQMHRSFRENQAQVQLYTQRSLADIWDMGRLLEEIRATLPRGQFTPWLKERGIADSTAKNWRDTFKLNPANKDAIVNSGKSMRELLNLNNPSLSSTLKKEEPENPFVEHLNKVDEVQSQEGEIVNGKPQGETVVITKSEPVEDALIVVEQPKEVQKPKRQTPGEKVAEEYEGLGAETDRINEPFNNCIKVIKELQRVRALKSYSHLTETINKHLSEVNQVFKEMHQEIAEIVKK